MFTTNGTVKTEHAAKYLQQLCKHFAHKVDVVLDDTKGEVAFPMGRCTIIADDTALRFSGQSEKAQGIVSMKAVIISHLDKFAWREAPVDYVWDDGQA